MKRIKVGDVLVSTFGYEACIPCFWKVLARTSKSLRIARLLDVKNTGNWDDGTAMPLPNSRVSDVSMLKRIHETVRCEYVDTGGRGAAYPWSGEPVTSYNHH
jgi:hypothetical protein